jgi:hypothetical protein
MSRPLLVIGLVLLGLVVPSPAGALPPPAGRQPGRATQAAVQAHAAAHHAGSCNVGVPIIGGAVSTITNLACGAAGRPPRRVRGSVG